MSHLERAESVRATVRSVALSAAPARAAEQRPNRAGGPRSPSVSVVHHKRVHRGSRIRVNAAAGTRVEQERRHPFLRRDEDAVALPLQVPAPGVCAQQVRDRVAAQHDAGTNHPERSAADTARGSLASWCRGRSRESRAARRSASCGSRPTSPPPARPSSSTRSLTERGSGPHRTALSASGGEIFDRQRWGIFHPARSELTVS